MKTNISNLTPQSFEIFVSSLLRQKATEENYEILFEAPLPADISNNVKYMYDAVAPYGFGDYTTPVIFEYKYNLNHKSIESVFKSISNRIALSKTYVEVTVIVITNTDISYDYYTPLEKGYVDSKGITIKVWGRNILETWTEQYPIDFSNAVAAAKGSIQNPVKSFNITENDFVEKIHKNTEILKKVVQKDDGLALVLGAGMSVDPGAMSWRDLLLFFEKQLELKEVIDDSNSLCDKIGNSSITTAQLCKELYRYDRDYYWEIHNGLYKNAKPINTTYSIYQIARIIKASQYKKHFRVLTYNFDEYLEEYLDDIKVSYNTLYDAKCDIDDRLSIYHVHGFLPKVNYKSHMQSRHMDSIYLTEENYNALYNQPYSWQISSQLSFFRENTCLFVGCSLADPNIRRLLEMTSRENRVHYAILTKDSLSFNDLMIASNHFARLGVEIIWVNNFSDIYRILSIL